MAEIWDSNIAAHMWDTFDLVMFKIFWGHLVPLFHNGVLFEI